MLRNRIQAMIKKVLIILSINITLLIGGIFAIIEGGYFNGAIQIIDGQVHFNNEIVSNGKLMMTDVKPYMCADLMNKSILINLIGGEWVQVTGYDTLIHLNHVGFRGDSATLQGGVGDYMSYFSIIFNPGITGAKDKNMKIAISINDTIRRESIRPFSISKDNEGEALMETSVVLLTYTNNSVVKMWVMSENNANIIYTDSHIYFEKL